MSNRDLDKELEDFYSTLADEMFENVEVVEVSLDELFELARMKEEAEDLEQDEYPLYEDFYKELDFNDD